MSELNRRDAIQITAATALAAVGTTLLAGEANANAAQPALSGVGMKDLVGRRVRVVQTNLLFSGTINWVEQSRIFLTDIQVHEDLKKLFAGTEGILVDTSSGAFQHLFLLQKA